MVRHIWCAVLYDIIYCRIWPHYRKHGFRVRSLEQGKQSILMSRPDASPEDQLEKEQSQGLEACVWRHDFFDLLGGSQTSILWSVEK
jgi:hypothetical protein